MLPTVPGEEGVLPLNENSFEGSYVAVSGRPGQRTVHVVNGRDGNFAGTGKYVLLNAPICRVILRTCWFYDTFLFVSSLQKSILRLW